MSDGKEEAKRIRYLPETEKLMRQFLKLETGTGNNSRFQRGHDFNFTFTQSQRDQVYHMMESGLSFDEAFDAVKHGTGTR